MQAGNNEPLTLICSICCGEYGYFVSGRPPLRTMLYFYKQQSYAVKFIWILKFIKFILAYTSWQQGVPQGDTLHMLWIIQIPCISGTSIGKSQCWLFVIRHLSYAIWIPKLTAIFVSLCNLVSMGPPGCHGPGIIQILCIWGPGSPTNSVSFFRSNKFMQLNLYEYLSLLWLLFWILQAGNNEPLRVAPSMHCG